MKVLVFDRNSADEFNAADAAVEMIPDSAIIKDGKPFFIPASSDRWTYSCGVALRVCRLGKNMPEKFAPRYIDAYAPCITTKPVTGGELNALDRCHEGAVILGEWRSPEDVPDSFEFYVGDALLVKIPVDKTLAARIVALAGSRGVMKIGDIIVMNEDCIAENLPVDTRISARGESADEPLLGFSVK